MHYATLKFGKYVIQLYRIIFLIRRRQIARFVVDLSNYGLNSCCAKVLGTLDGKGKPPSFVETRINRYCTT